MAVSQVEEKILGRLARQTAPSNPLLSASFYQVLGLSILLSRKLYRARKVRRLDITRDTKSLQLYHHIIWLAREGLSITEVYILPYCQDGEQGAECRVMAAKLRASLYHVFCLFHNHPPISAISSRSPGSGSSPASTRASKDDALRSPRISPGGGGDGVAGRRRPGRSELRDPILSITSEASYLTNPFAGLTQTPPAAGMPPLVPSEATRRTPTRPPGLAPINIASPQAAASFLLPPLNFVPMAKEHFENVQNLANNLLSPTNALRLSVSLEHAAFTWDCEKEHERARRSARRTIKEVYASTDGLDDDEFADAAALVQALGGIVRRGGAGAGSRESESVRRPSSEQLARVASPNQPGTRAPRIDRTIAVSPTYGRNTRKPASASPVQRGAILRSPERLSTVPEVESTDASQSEAGHDLPTTSPPVSSRSGRSRPRRASSTASDKASKRRAVEAAEEIYRRNSASRASNTSSRAGHASGPPSRQATPSEGAAPTPAPIPARDPRPTPVPGDMARAPPAPSVRHRRRRSESTAARASSHDRRDAILGALDVISSKSQGLRQLRGSRHGTGAYPWRIL